MVTPEWDYECFFIFPSLLLTTSLHLYTKASAKRAWWYRPIILALGRLREERGLRPAWGRDQPGARPCFRKASEGTNKLLQIACLWTDGAAADTQQWAQGVLTQM